MEMKRILIVEVNWRGDVLFSTPFIRALRKAYPQSFIAALVVTRCYEILEHNPQINQIITYNDNKGLRGLFQRAKLVLQLRRRRFDTVFLLHRSATRALICWLAAIPRRIGYYRRKRRFLINFPVAPAPAGLHKIDYFLNLSSALDIPAQGRDCEFFTSAQDEDFAREFLKGNRIAEGELTVAINPGGNWKLKRWLPENFARVADVLIDRHNARIIITGSEKDARLAEQISSKMKNTAVISAGKTTLAQLAALLKKVDLLISNDSGPLHIAASQGTKTIAIFGPTSPEITGPCNRDKTIILQKDVGCNTPCYNLPCLQARCMDAVSVNDVLSACEKILNL